MKKFLWVILIIGLVFLGLWFKAASPYWSDPIDLQSADESSLKENDHVVAEFEYSGGYCMSYQGKNTNVELYRIYMMPIFGEDGDTLTIDKFLLIEVEPDNFGIFDRMTDNFSDRTEYDFANYMKLYTKSDYVSKMSEPYTADRILVKAGAQDIAYADFNVNWLKSMQQRWGFDVVVGDMTVIKSYKLAEGALSRELTMIFGGAFAGVGLLGLIICFLKQKREDKACEKAYAQFCADNNIDPSAAGNAAYNGNAGSSWGTGNNLNGGINPNNGNNVYGNAGIGVNGNGNTVAGNANVNKGASAEPTGNIPGFGTTTKAFNTNWMSKETGESVSKATENSGRTVTENVGSRVTGDAGVKISSENKLSSGEQTGVKATEPVQPYSSLTPQTGVGSQNSYGMPSLSGLGGNSDLTSATNTGATSYGDSIRAVSDAEVSDMFSSFMEKANYEVALEAVNDEPGSKARVTSYVRELTGWTQDEADEAFKKLPQVIVKTQSKGKADSIKRTFEEYGATISVTRK